MNKQPGSIPCTIYVLQYFISNLYHNFINQKQWECINQKKQAKKKGYKNSGVIILREIKVFYI